MADHLFAIEGDDAGPAVALAEFAHEAGAAVVAVGNREVDRADLHFEHVAGIGPFDVNRPREDVPPGAAIGHLGDDVAQRLLDVASCNAGGFEA